MCLIITGPSSKIRHELLTNGEMRDSIFSSNEDGLGYMYRNKRGLRVVRQLPRDDRDVMEMLRSLPNDDRPLAMHWRMRTHGDISLANCHPYDVLPGRIALMHNGILATGNAADPTKSDTWHFIQDFLAQPFSEHPEMVRSEAFKKECEEFIGNNRFVFMDRDGHLVILNKDQGVEHGGLWFANTYAWDAGTFIPHYKRRFRWGGYGAYRGGDGIWMPTQHTSGGHVYDFRSPRNSARQDDSSAYNEWLESRYPLSPRSQIPLIGHRRAWNEDEFLAAVHSADADLVGDYMEDHPRRSVLTLLLSHRASYTKHAGSGDGLAVRQRTIADMCIGVSANKLVAEAERSPAQVAEVICYFLDWREINEAETTEAQTERDESSQTTTASSSTPGLVIKFEDAPDARYLGCKIYVREDVDQKFSFYIVTPGGEVLDYDSGYATREFALSCAIEAMSLYDGTEAADTALDSAETEWLSLADSEDTVPSAELTGVLRFDDETADDDERATLNIFN